MVGQQLGGDQQARFRRVRKPPGSQRFPLFQQEIPMQVGVIVFEDDESRHSVVTRPVSAPRQGRGKKGRHLREALQQGKESQ